MGKPPQNSLHHGKVFTVVVGLKEGMAEGKFENDTTNAPNVTGMRPAKFQDDFWSAIMPRRDNGAVMLMIKGG